MTQRNVLRMFMLAGVLLVSIVLHAQPGDPGDNPEVPITGIELLLLGGAAYGAKKVYEVYRKRK